MSDRPNKISASDYVTHYFKKNVDNIRTIFMSTTLFTQHYGKGRSQEEKIEIMGRYIISRGKEPRTPGEWNKWLKKLVQTTGKGYREAKQKPCTHEQYKIDHHGILNTITQEVQGCPETERAIHSLFRRVALRVSPDQNRTPVGCETEANKKFLALSDFKNRCLNKLETEKLWEEAQIKLQVARRNIKKIKSLLRKHNYFDIDDTKLYDFIDEKVEDKNVAKLFKQFHRSLGDEIEEKKSWYKNCCDPENAGIITFKSILKTLKCYEMWKEATASYSEDDLQPVQNMVRIFDAWIKGECERRGYTPEKCNDIYAKKKREKREAKDAANEEIEIQRRRNPGTYIFSQSVWQARKPAAISFFLYYMVLYEIVSLAKSMEETQKAWLWFGNNFYEGAETVAQTTTGGVLAFGGAGAMIGAMKAFAVGGLSLNPVVLGAAGLFSMVFGGSQLITSNFFKKLLGTVSVNYIKEFSNLAAYMAPKTPLAIFLFVFVIWILFFCFINMRLFKTGPEGQRKIKATEDVQGTGRQINEKKKSKRKRKQKGLEPPREVSSSSPSEQEEDETTDNNSSSESDGANTFELDGKKDGHIFVGETSDQTKIKNIVELIEKDERLCMLDVPRRVTYNRPRFHERSVRKQMLDALNFQGNILYAYKKDRSGLVTALALVEVKTDGKNSVVSEIREVSPNVLKNGKVRGIAVLKILCRRGRARTDPQNDKSVIPNFFTHLENVLLERYNTNLVLTKITSKRTIRAKASKGIYEKLISGVFEKKLSFERSHQSKDLKSVYLYKHIRR